MRRQSKTVTVRGVAIGGGSRVTVQSMTNTDTADRDATLAQIRALEREIEKQEQHSAELDRQTYFLTASRNASATSDRSSPPSSRSRNVTSIFVTGSPDFHVTSQEGTAALLKVA